MGRFRNTIVDAHEQRVPLIRHEVLTPLLSDDARRERLMNAGYNDMAKGMRAPQAKKMYWVMTPLMAIVALAPTIVIVAFGLPKWTWLATAPWPAIACLQIGIFCMRRFAKRELVGVYLRAKYCASCGYDLTNARADGEGVTVCPECGAAWELERK